MSIHCCPTPEPQQSENPRYRRVLWIALGINFGMFLIEMGASFAAGSSSLQADALDFLADAANYAISLYVVSRSLRTRAIAALIKGASMAVFGLGVIGTTIWHALSDTLPQAETMGVIGVAALIANLIVLALLRAYRAGDSNMRSVWICSRNDVIGNFAVLFAAAGVFGTGKGWPDLAVASIMAILALQGAFQIIGSAREEIMATRR